MLLDQRQARIPKKGLRKARNNTKYEGLGGMKFHVFRDNSCLSVRQAKTGFSIDLKCDQHVK
jgi:hypothetical protein